MTQYPQQPHDEPPSPLSKPKRVRKVPLILLGAGILAAAGVVVALILPGGEKKPTVFNVTGTITVEAGDSSAGVMGGNCVTEGGYADIHAGTQVTVKDGTGKVIALGSLAEGRTSDVQTLPKFNPEIGEIENVPQATTCAFGLSVASVPEGESFYSVEVSHRGELRFGRVDLASALALTLNN